MFITKDHHWKTCFFIIGGVTCIFALIATLTIKEYRKPEKSDSTSSEKQAETGLEVSASSEHPESRDSDSSVESNLKNSGKAQKRNTSNTRTSKASGSEVSNSSRSASTEENNESKASSSPFAILFTSPVFWLISSCYLLWSLVKVGSEDWLQLYLLTGRSSSQTEGKRSI